MGMQEKVDCDNEWRGKKSASMSPGKSVVCDYENGESGGVNIQEMLGKK